MSTEQPQWRHSSYCGTNACVEIAHFAGKVLIRDSKTPESAPIAFDLPEWTAFLQGVRAGEFSLDRLAD
jgi:hypothetical protein